MRGWELVTTVSASRDVTGRVRSEGRESLANEALCTPKASRFKALSGKSESIRAPYIKLVSQFSFSRSDSPIKALVHARGFFVLLELCHRLITPTKISPSPAARVP